ncbi:MAG: hypothetical protein SGI92_04255 [Bryobacteraceae bacterium]|nr:hypothetical protein [Bryobacteraceae bacterium]
MRWLALLPALLLSAEAQTWSLYVCMATTKDYVVGAKLLPSGVFRRAGASDWRQSGHPNPFTFSLDYDRRDPSKLYLAAGNGLIALTPDQPAWRVLTSGDVTEMRDVAVSPDGAIYYAYVRGVRVSRDAGRTWSDIGATLPNRYTEVIRVDRDHRGVLLAGTVDGIWRSDNDGASWARAGVAGFSIMDIEQSPHDPCHWMVTTERGGIFSSGDCGKTFEALGRLAVDRVLYDVAFDPTTPGRVAVAGWGLGVAISDDNGKTWTKRNATLPSDEVWSVAFDPGKKGRLFAGVHEQAMYVSEDGGLTWKPDGLEGTVITRMKFVPSEAGK